MTREQPSNLAKRVTFIPAANMLIALKRSLDVNVVLIKDHSVTVSVDFRCTY